MTRISRLILATACSAGILSGTFAADVKKNMPSRSDVEDILEAIGEDHFPEKMKISPVGSVETDSTYYHVFSGVRKDNNFNLIFFDNTPTYLGYYLITPQPIGASKGQVDLYLTSDSTTRIQIGDEGPPDRIRIDAIGQSANFARAPVKEEPVEEVTGASGDDTPAKMKKAPEYRPWTVTKNGRELNIESAIFVEMKGRNVTIKNGKNGLVATVPASSLSPADKEYLKNLLQ